MCVPGAQFLSKKNYSLWDGQTLELNESIRRLSSIRLMGVGVLLRDFITLIFLTGYDVNK